jgi:AraC-like DNA-binding protein/CheY-like chemotaxis protein
MPELRLLWVGSGSSAQSSELRSEARLLFHVALVPLDADLGVRVNAERPHVVCFDFDEPAPEALHVMRDLKRSNPSTPVLMLTQAHSESLAVWSFRSRVWNYLVKPVSLREFRANLATLAQMLRDRDTRGRSSRPAYAVGALVPSGLPGTESHGGSDLAAATAYVEANFATELRQSKAAALCGMSPTQFSRAFSARFGIAFRAYVIRHRVSVACRLLRDTGMTLIEITQATGFCDAAHFCRTFKRCCGMLPSEYRLANARPAATASTARAGSAAPVQRTPGRDSAAARTMHRS